MKKILAAWAIEVLSAAYELYKRIYHKLPPVLWDLAIACLYDSHTDYMTRDMRKWPAAHPNPLEKE